MTHYTPRTVPRPPRLAALLALLSLPAAAPARDAVGPETCRACHPAAFEVWRETAHARAHANLPERQRSDPRCTGCHAPLGEKASGVSCEACHGNGQLYARAHVMRDRELARALGLQQPGERTCLACHTESAPSLSRFDYARKLPLLQHAEAEREARRAAGRR
jgi:Zn finger protein HypA/HybF involved in hydrogenase expression